MVLGIRTTVVGLAVLASLNAVLFAAEPARPPRRARPPVWSRDVLDAFFDDAREHLKGPRPDYQPQATTIGESASAGGEPVVTARFAWSQLIDSDTLETEIKRLSQSIDSTVTTPSAFKGGGYKDARRDFSELAVLFAVTGQHDGQPRWQDAAPGLRDLFARAGRNAKVGTDATYGEAAARKLDLAELVRGGRPQVPQADAAITDWSQVAAREPLMQRLNIAHEERLTKWLADAAAFRHNRKEVRHEAQLVAMIAEVIDREGFDYWDEEEYASHARELRGAATELSAAAAADNYDEARNAIDRATNACASCHEDYRG